MLIFLYPEFNDSLKNHNKTNWQIFSFLMCVLCCCFSHVQLFPIPWTVTCQAPLSMGILQARTLEWVPNTGIKPSSLALADGIFNTITTWEGPRILDWVSMPCSRESSWPRDWTSVSCLLNCLLGSLPLAQPVILPGKSHGRRSLVGCSPGDRWELDTTKWLPTFTFHFHELEKEMATHSSDLAWRIPGTGEPGGLPSMGSHRVRHDWSDLAAAAAATWEAL